MKTVAVSGGFDPIHPGHLNLIFGARTLADMIDSPRDGPGRLVVILNTDAWLEAKKGFYYQPWRDRARIMAAVRGVDTVRKAEDADGTVCLSLREIRPDIFANGGDRGPDTTPEDDLCQELGVEAAYGVGGVFKAGSSSQLVRRSWGWYEVLDRRESHVVKRLTVLPGRETSLQSHEGRDEQFATVAGEGFLEIGRLGDGTVLTPGATATVPLGHLHKIRNVGEAVLVLIETWTGEALREEDVTRYD